MKNSYHNLIFEYMISKHKFKNRYTYALLLYTIHRLELILIYRRFNAIVSQLKMHYFSEGDFESLIASEEREIYLIILISKQCMESYQFPLPTQQYLGFWMM